MMMMMMPPPAAKRNQILDLEGTLTWRPRPPWRERT